MTTAKQTFIASTIGLRAFNQTMGKSRQVRIEYARNADGTVQLSTVSAHTLGQNTGAGVRTISAAEFADRPTDPYDDVAEARWAMKKCGWSIDADDSE